MEDESKKGSKISLVVGGVGIRRGRIVNSQKAMLALADSIDPYLNDSGFLLNAPFEVVSFIFRYGDVYGEPQIDAVDLKHAELPVAAEVPIDELRVLPQDQVEQAFASVLIPSLRAVATKFALPTSGIDKYCQERGLKM